MLNRIVVAVAIGVIVFLVCILGGAVLGALHVSVLTTIGDFLTQYAVLIGVLGAVLSFFAGWSPFGGARA